MTGAALRQLCWGAMQDRWFDLQVGVAGRTGCGKSTLMMALYRLVEPSGGQIIIDGINTGSIGLQDLRSRLALVPQVLSYPLPSGTRSALPSPDCPPRHTLSGILQHHRIS